MNITKWPFSERDDAEGDEEHNVQNPKAATSGYGRIGEEHETSSRQSPRSAAGDLCHRLRNGYRALDDTGARRGPLAALRADGGAMTESELVAHARAAIYRYLRAN